MVYDGFSKQETDAEVHFYFYGNPIHDSSPLSHIHSSMVTPKGTDIGILLVTITSDTFYFKGNNYGD